MERSELARAHARRAYERARLGGALLAAWPVPIVLAIAAILHEHIGAAALICGGALAAVLVIASWRGESWRRGALAGVLAGLPPLIVPAVMLTLRGQVHCAGCTPSMSAMLACTLICLTTAIASGVAVGLRAVRDPSPVRFAASALAVAAVIGLMACGATGLGGAAGVVVGLAAGGIPALALSRRAA
jgi:hypothetical protein